MTRLAEQQPNLDRSIETSVDLSGVSCKTRPAQTVLTLIASDLIALSLAGVGAFAIRYLSGLMFMERLQEPWKYWELWPLLGLFIPVYLLSRLYPGIMAHPGMGTAEELRRTSMATLVGFSVLGASTFVFRGAEGYSRAIFLTAWALTFFTVPVCRAITRSVFAHRPWWGYSVVVLGCERNTEAVIKSLQIEPQLGMKPVAILHDSAEGEILPASIQDVPIVGDLELTPVLSRAAGLKYAVVALPRSLHARLFEMNQPQGHGFPQLLFVPRLLGEGLGVEDMEIRERLLLSGPRFTKRTMDLILTILFGLILAPFLALVAIAIKLDSKGGVFYAQTRVGRNGRYFKAWKFRSMVNDADDVLKSYLTAHPELQEEWDATHKLKDDPRVTHVGRLLRKTSLDELPQLWNVLKGEMSLIGPRAIVHDEIKRYGTTFSLYLKTRPGMTGLWQVSGRSDRTYRERVTLDAYYVRNWTVWLDLYILARTIKVVLFGKGAY